MVLRAKKPEAKEKRLKMFIYGSPGVGKTLCAIQFPQAYLIDTEKGSDFYSKSINNAGSVVFQSPKFNDVKAEVKELLTTQHPYKTVIIDPITHVYNDCQAKWSKVFEDKMRIDLKDESVINTQDFGMRYWGKVKGDFKTLERMFFELDMNVIITAHQKDVYGNNFSKLGVTFDSMKGDDYLFDYVFRIEKRGDKIVAVVVKERAEIGEAKFPPEFEWSYANFIKFYGKDVIERSAVPVELASDEDISIIRKLIDVVKVEKDVVDSWFEKAEVSDFTEMKKKDIDKCIKYLKDKVSVLSVEDKPEKAVK
jgi:hypothetical protein